MESKVILSKYCWIITVTITVFLVGAAVYGSAIDESGIFFTLTGILLVLLIPSLIYAPRKIKVMDNRIFVKSWLKIHQIQLCNVAEVELFMPTIGAKSVCASGGFLGYWGIFSEGDVGRYMAYYGKSSDCFMLRMKNDKTYVLGCKNPKAMVDYIHSLLRNCEQRAVSKK